MNPAADLHIHTYFSDGTYSPQEVLDEALKEKLSCIAITDHDTMEGISATQALAAASGIEVIPGVELSSELRGKEVHILGYLVDKDDVSWLAHLSMMQKARQERMRKMIAKLYNLGVKDISFDEVCADVRSGSVGRPHLAAVLVKKGWVSSLKEAFDKYLAEGAPAYAAKFRQSPAQAIALIRRSGGVAVLAHPMLTQIDADIPALVEQGLQGLEVFYPNVSQNVVESYARMAQEQGLIATGGSDAHGATKTYTRIGKVKVPYETVKKLKAAAERNVIP